MFFPQIEGVVVGSVSGKCVHGAVPCKEWVPGQEVRVHGNVLCSSCMFLILPEPPHDPGIKH